MKMNGNQSCGFAQGDFDILHEELHEDHNQFSDSSPVILEPRSHCLILTQNVAFE